MEPSWGRPTPSRVSPEAFLGSVWPLVGSPEALVEPSQAENATSTEKLPGFRNLGDDSDRSGVLLGFIGAVWGRSGGHPWAIGLPPGSPGCCPQASGRERRTLEGLRAPGAKPGYNEGQGPVRARTASSGGQHGPRSEDTLGPHQVTTRDGLPCGPDRQALGGPHQVTSRAPRLFGPHRQGQSRLQRGPENPSGSHRPSPLLLGYIYIYIYIYTHIYI